MKSLLLFCLTFFAFCAPVHCAPPDTCLQQISSAIENEDVEAFQQAIDMDALLNNSVELWLRNLQNSDSALSPVLKLLLAQMNTQGGQAIRNMLLLEAKAFVLNGVSSGAFAGREPEFNQSQGVLAPLFANASLGRKEIRGTGEPAADGDGWLMPFNLHDYGNDSDYLIIGRFEPANGSARLVGIENLEQLFEQIQKDANGY